MIMHLWRFWDMIEQDVFRGFIESISLGRAVALIEC